MTRIGDMLLSTAGGAGGLRGESEEEEELVAVEEEGGNVAAGGGVFGLSVPTKGVPIVSSVTLVALAIAEVVTRVE